MKIRYACFHINVAYVTLSTLGNFSRRQLVIVLFSHKIGFGSSSKLSRYNLHKVPKAILLEK